MYPHCKFTVLPKQIFNNFKMLLREGDEVLCGAVERVTGLYHMHSPVLASG